MTRHYDDPAAMQQDVINARVWSGIHFHTADVVGRDLGVQVANWALDHQFAAVPVAPVPTVAPVITAPPTDFPLASTPPSGEIPLGAFGLLAVLALSFCTYALVVRRR